MDKKIIKKLILNNAQISLFVYTSVYKQGLFRMISKNVDKKISSIFTGLAS